MSILRCVPVWNPSSKAPKLKHSLELKPLMNWGEHRQFGHSGPNETEKRGACYNAGGFYMPKMPDLLSVNGQRRMQPNFGAGRIGRQTRNTGHVLRHYDVLGVQSKKEEVH